MQTNGSPAFKYHFLQLVADLYDHAAVGFIDFDFLAVHDQQTLLVVYGEECDAAVLMVNRCDVLVIGNTQMSFG